MRTEGDGCQLPTRKRAACVANANCQLRAMFGPVGIISASMTSIRQKFNSISHRALSGTTQPRMGRLAGRGDKYYPQFRLRYPIKASWNQ